MKEILLRKVEFNDDQLKYVLNELKKNKDSVENSTFYTKEHLKIFENKTYLDIMNHTIGARFSFMYVILKNDNVLNYSEKEINELDVYGNSEVEGDNFLEKISNLILKLNLSTKLIKEVINELNFSVEDTLMIKHNSYWLLESMLVHTFNHIGQIEQQLAQEGINISTNLLTKNYKHLI